MQRLTIVAILGSAATLALSGCGGNDNLPANQMADADTTMPYEAPMTDNAMMPLPVTLTPTQQRARDALNMQAYEAEYRRYEAEPMPSGTNTPAAGMTGTPTPAAGATGTPAGQSGAMSPNAAGSNNFAQLDRNSDNRLSVAEYAVYAIGMDPMQSTPNDQRPPHATADQLNRAADTFFQYDTDGNTYLSASEFNAARQAGAASQTQ